MPSAPNIAKARFGKDLDFRKTENRGSATGGAAPTVEGSDNLLLALTNRLVMPQGDLVHRPEYGNPVEADVPNSPTFREKLAVAVRGSILQDPRVATAQVGVRSIDQNTVLVEVVATPVGDRENTVSLSAALGTR